MTTVINQTFIGGDICSIINYHKPLIEVKIMHSSLQIFAAILAVANVFPLMILCRLKQPVSFVCWVVKVFVTALLPFFALAALIAVVLAILTGSYLLTLPAIFSIAVLFIHLYRVKKVMNSSTGLAQAYGPDWEERLPFSRKAGFLSSPFLSAIRIPSAFVLKQDIPFCKVPGTTQDLLCDLWAPTEGVERSGLAFIYFHGSAWTILDKDFGTRPLFKHLVSQGHVIMDVAYRLFPETDMAGMVNDVYRAIAWMKSNAADLQVKPDRIVIGGASAGAHLSSLAAYSMMDQAFVPVELYGTDLSVHAVISAYGPTDLKAMYYHTGQHVTTNRSPKPASSPSPLWVQKMMGKNFHRLGFDKDAAAIGVLPVMLGCSPDECPEVYTALSPITYINSNCPQTLILQGMHDLIVPVEATRQLYRRLNEEGVKAAMYLIPQTDHAFDLILPRISPVAHAAIYLIERFLAIQCEPAHHTI